MTTEYVGQGEARSTGSAAQWIVLGLLAAASSVLAVILVQSLAIRMWPQVALFAPLDSYARTALFTAVPALAATFVLAWLARRRQRPVRDFLLLSAVLLAISVVPDYLLPVPNRTVLASTVAAVLHVVAATVIVSVLILGYQKRSRP